MILVKKKNKKLQICINYKKLNKYTQKHHFFLFINAILKEGIDYELYILDRY